MIKKIILLLLASLLTVGCNDKNIITEPIENTIEDGNSITLTSVGDVMAHMPQLEAQLQDDKTYNFDNNFKYIKPIIENSDISIANLETTVNPNKNVSGYPSFNSPPELLNSLKNTGFDVISTINNHSLDTGYSGVISTLNELKKINLKSVGTKLSEEEKNYITIKVKDINIGITTFSYGDIVGNDKYLNGIRAGKSAGLLNVIDNNKINSSFETIKKEIDLMKSENVDFIIVGLHWGEEYKQNPNSYQKELAQLLANEGVDLILGSHPHVVQPIEYIKSETSDEECLVVYSMGNIISNQREEEMGFKESENGIIPIIDIEKNDNGDTVIKNAQYIPTWVNKYTKNNKVYYEIIPIDDDIDTIANKTKSDKDDLTISYNNTVSLMNDERIKVYKKTK